MANWPTGPATPDRNGIALLDMGVLRTHVAGREDIGQEQDLLVLEVVGHGEGAGVGKRHADIFGLSTGVAARHVTVAEQARRRMAHQGIGNVLRVGRIRVVATRPQLLFTEETRPAGDGERE